MPTYRNWKTTFDVKLLRLVRTSCRPLSQTRSVAFSSSWAVVANISSISSSIDMLFMKQGMQLCMHVRNLYEQSLRYSHFLGSNTEESHCIIQHSSQFSVPGTMTCKFRFFPLLNYQRCLCQATKAYVGGGRWPAFRFDVE